MIYSIIIAFNIWSEQQNSNKYAKREAFDLSSITKIVIFIEYAVCRLYFSFPYKLSLKRTYADIRAQSLSGGLEVSFRRFCQFFCVFVYLVKALNLVHAF